MIFNNLYTYLTNHNLITKNQSGFRSGDSTTNQLLFLVNEIHEAFENPKSLEVRAVFLDISKAFDKVWHDGLIFKLEQNGVSGNLLKLTRSYLHNRKQRVVINGSCSDYYSIESGVPQGSVLGPLLFLIFINDLEHDIKSRIKFFADDTMLFSIVHDSQTSANELNHDLLTIQKWAFQWKMEFNPDPSKQATDLLFSCKKNKIVHPPLIFNNQVVKRVEYHKHLGLILDSGLSFVNHINAKIALAKKNIGIIRHLSKHLPLQVLSQMYKVFVRSHFDYCDFIYHVPPLIRNSPLEISLNHLMESIEKVQYMGALAVTGAWQGSNRSKLYEEIGWETLSDRRMYRRLLQLYKITNNMTPDYLSNKLPPKKRPFLYSNHETLLFREFRCHTSRYANSFFPDAVTTWNRLIGNFDLMPSIGKFKLHIISLTRPMAKSIFKVHDPIGLRFLFMLRLELSPLRSHKFNYNFADTNSNVCACNDGIENTDHYFLKCSNFSNQRRTLLRSVNDILKKYNVYIAVDNYRFFLYGHHLLSQADNKVILHASIKFIKETKRFSNQAD